MISANSLSSSNATHDSSGVALTRISLLNKACSNVARRSAYPRRRSVRPGSADHRSWTCESGDHEASVALGRDTERDPAISEPRVRHRTKRRPIDLLGRDLGPFAGRSVL